jgi:prevent-host-death family protein
MTQTSINVTEARDNLSEILGRVKFGQEVVTIEKKGKPYAVIVSPEQYEAFQKEARKRFAGIIRRIQSRNTMFSDAEIMKDVLEEIEAVRNRCEGRRVSNHGSPLTPIPS